MSRILLILDHKENRRLLADVLAPHYDLIVPDSDSALGDPFDLGIVDGRALDRLQQQVQARKQAELPAVLPFLLVTARYDVGMATRHLWTTVDDLIISPIEKVELLARVAGLMKTRQLSLEFNRIVIQASPLAIIVTDQRGLVSRWNPAAERILGWSQEEALGQRLPVAVEGGDDELRRLLDKVLRGEQVTGLETRRRKKDGSLVDICIATAAVRDMNGMITNAIAVVDDVTERKQAEEAVQQSHEHLRELTVRLIETEETERRNLSRELHDRVGQMLAALNINLGIVQNQLPEDSASKISSRLADSTNLVRETMACVRDVMADLYPSVLTDFGLGEALRWYADRFTRRTAIAVKVEEVGARGSRPPAQIETVLFRVAQEALTNIARHAGANQIRVTVDTAAQAARLTIEDDGRGFEPRAVVSDAQHGWGLRTMRERIEGIGGKFRVDSSPGRGTRIIAEIALASPASATS
jgi:PAS domain S-box-containing protein